MTDRDDTVSLPPPQSNTRSFCNFENYHATASALLVGCHGQPGNLAKTSGQVKLSIREPVPNCIFVSVGRLTGKPSVRLHVHVVPHTYSCYRVELIVIGWHLHVASSRKAACSLLPARD